MKSKEQDHDEEHGPYWQHDLAIGEACIQRDAHTIRLRVHHSEERYRKHNELFPLLHKTGVRDYVHAKPYILVPDITLTVDLYPQPKPSDAVGEVVSSRWEGMRPQDIGQAQAWLYRPERTIMLWECFLEGRFRQDDPTHDEVQRVLWTGFERWLVERFPGAERIATPFREPLYPDEQWQQFLRAQGYTPFTLATFAKEGPAR